MLPKTLISVLDLEGYLLSAATQLSAHFDVQLGHVDALHNRQRLKSLRRAELSFYYLGISQAMLLCAGLLISRSHTQIAIHKNEHKTILFLPFSEPDPVQKRSVAVLHATPTSSSPSRIYTYLTSSITSHHLIKRRNKRLRQPKAKHQLRPRHKQLRHQPLKERRRALLPCHPTNNLEPTLGIFEISVLDSGFDDVERGGDDEGGGGAGDRGDEVLGPGCGVVVFEFVEVLFCCCGAAEELFHRTISIAAFLAIYVLVHS